MPKKKKSSRSHSGSSRSHSGSSRSHSGPSRSHSGSSRVGAQMLQDEEEPLPIDNEELTDIDIDRMVSNALRNLPDDKNIRNLRVELGNPDWLRIYQEIAYNEVRRARKKGQLIKEEDKKNYIRRRMQSESQKRMKIIEESQQVPEQPSEIIKKNCEHILHVFNTMEPGDIRYFKDVDDCSNILSCVADISKNEAGHPDVTLSTDCQNGSLTSSVEGNLKAQMVGFCEKTLLYNHEVKLPSHLQNALIRYLPKWDIFTQFLKLSIIKTADGNRICSFFAYIYEIIYLVVIVNQAVNKSQLYKPHNNLNSNFGGDGSIVTIYLSTLVDEIIYRYTSASLNKMITKEQFLEIILKLKEGDVGRNMIKYVGQNVVIDREFFDDSGGADSKRKLIHNMYLLFEHLFSKIISFHQMIDAAGNEDELHAFQSGDIYDNRLENYRSLLDSPVKTKLDSLPNLEAQSIRRYDLLVGENDGNPNLLSLLIKYLFPEGTQSTTRAMSELATNIPEYLKRYPPGIRINMCYKIIKFIKEDPAQEFVDFPEDFGAENTTEEEWKYFLTDADNESEFYRILESISFTKKNFESIDKVSPPTRRTQSSERDDLSEESAEEDDELLDWGDLPNAPSVASREILRSEYQNILNYSFGSNNFSKLVNIQDSEDISEEIIELSINISNFLEKKNLSDILGSLTKYYMETPLERFSREEKEKFKSYDIFGKNKAMFLSDLKPYESLARNDQVLLTLLNDIKQAIEDPLGRHDIKTMIDKLVARRLEIERKKSKKSKRREVHKPTIKVFWITLITFILIIFASNPDHDKSKFMVKGGVSLILNTEEIPAGRERESQPKIDTSDIDISLRPDEGKELPVLSFHLVVTILLTGHLLLKEQNSFNDGLDITELRKYMELNYTNWTTGSGDQIKLLQIGKKYETAGVPGEYICDLVIEEKPFSEVDATSRPTRRSPFVSDNNPLNDALVREISESLLGGGDVSYFQYRSLRGNVNEYDNMMKNLLSLANTLLKTTEAEEFYSNLPNFTNINTKLPKLRERLYGFRDILPDPEMGPIVTRINKKEQANVLEFVREFKKYHGSSKDFEGKGYQDVINQIEHGLKLKNETFRRTRTRTRTLGRDRGGGGVLKTKKKSKRNKSKKSKRMGKKRKTRRKSKR